MRKYISRAIITISALVSYFAYADVATQDHNEMDIMVVTATKSNIALKDVPVSISVVTPKDIERSGATTVADLLQDVPGVELVTNSQPGMKRIRIRNNHAGATLILVDGERLTDQASPDGVPLIIDPASIERIEVVKGPASVLYGSDATGGVVNIITKKGGGEPIQGQFSTQYNSNTTSLDSRFTLYGGYQGYYYRFSGQKVNDATQEQLFKVSSKTYNSQTGFENKGVTGQFGYANDKLDVSINLETQDSYNWLSALDYTSSYAFKEYQRKRKKASVRGEFYPLSETITHVAANAYTQKSTNVGSNEVKSIGFATQADFTPNDSHYITIGYDGWQDEMKRLDSSLEAKQKSNAIFIQDQWALLPSDFTLTLGARYTTVESQTHFSHYRNWEESEPTFSAALTYTGIDDVTLRALYSQGFRAPVLGQLYGTGSSSMMTFISNDKLKHETSDNVEIGTRYLNDRTMIDLSVYYTRAEDFIAMKYDFTTYAYWYENVNKATMYGSELYAEHRFEDSYNLTPYTSLTFSHREYQYDATNFKTSKTATPLFDGKVGLKADKAFSNGLRCWADINLRFATKAESQSSSTVSVTKYEGWETINFGAGISYGQKQEVFASFNLNNIFDKHYFTVNSNLEEPGFHAVVQIGVRF